MRVVFALVYALVLAGCSEKQSGGRDRLDDARAWMEADAVVSELGDRIGVCVLRYDETKGEIVYDHEAEAVHPISGLGCAVIGHYADAWLAPQGRESVTLEERWICVAPSQTQEMGAGANVLVSTLIERSIAHLDPTAASHLLAHPRSDGIVSQMELWLSDPRNRPLLKPSEVERVKLAPLASIREKFVLADEAERRELLETEIAKYSAVEQMYDLWAVPVAVESVGYFASAISIARIARQMESTHADEPDRPLSGALDTLAPVPGFEDGWSLVGGEPGVVAWVGVVRTGEDSGYTISVLVHDADEPLDTQRVAGAIGAVVDALREVGSD